MISKNFLPKLLESGLKKIGLMFKIKLWKSIFKEKKMMSSGRLFYSLPQIREKTAMWRILKDIVYFSFLCNDTWKWFATEVPYKNGDNHGEIDILMCRPQYLRKDSPLIFKGYQVKVSLIDKHDKERSLKRSDSARFKKAVGQLKRLRTFGCDRVCFLEVIIFEQDRESSHFPEHVIGEINKKAAKLAKEKVGYVIMPIQFRPDIPENIGGYRHPPINILPSPEQERSVDFKKFASYIDSFFDSQTTNNGKGLPVINYCKECKSMGIVYAGEISLLCPNCGVMVV